MFGHHPGLALPTILAGLIVSIGAFGAMLLPAQQRTVAAVAAPWAGDGRGRAAPPARMTTARVCVSPWGFCPVPMMRTGDPCSCPHPLHGAVPGRVVPLDALEARRDRVPLVPDDDARPSAGRLFDD